MLVTPYGDPNAHGSIGKAITVIRRRGIAYARPWKKPYDPRSSAQLAQRQDFADAVADWHAQTTETQEYFNNASAGQSYSGFNLYVSMYLLGTLPSTTPLMATSITTAVIATTRGANTDSWKYRFTTTPAGTTYGRIYDNANSYAPDSSAPSPAQVKLIITDETETINILFKDTVSITVDGNPLTVFLPAYTGDELNLFLSDDGSTYYGPTLTRLACAPSP